LEVDGRQLNVEEDGRKGQDTDVVGLTGPARLGRNGHILL